MGLAGRSGTSLATAPPFTLPDPSTGSSVTLDAVRGTAATVVLFICEHCPYVVAVREVIQRVAADYAARGCAVVLISSNDVADYPADGPDAIAAAKTRYYPAAAAYLYDESQAVAKAYGAVCTPDVFIFDASLAAVYRGRIDASSPGNAIAPDGGYLRAALDALLNGRALPDAVPSMGCSIKWKD